MKKRKDRKISARLSSAFFWVNGIYILSIIALLISYVASNERLNNMNREAVSPQIAIGEIQNAILRERNAAIRLVLASPGSSAFATAAEDLEAENRTAVLEIGTFVNLVQNDTSAEIQRFYEDEYSAHIAELVRLAQNDQDAEAMELLSQAVETESRMDGLLAEATTLVSDRTAFYIKDAWIGLVRLFIIAGVLIIFVILFVVIIVRNLQRVISKRIEKLTEVADLLAEGNLEIEIGSDSTDEIGRLTDSFVCMINSINEQAKTLSAIAEGNLMVDISPRGEYDVMNTAIKTLIGNLNDMVTQILHSTDQVSVGAKQIADGAQSLAQGSAQQASAVEQLSGSIAEVSHITNDNSSLAQKAAGLMRSVSENAVNGSEQMGKMARAVNDISDASQAISRVMKVIDDIAFQTSILSLNAAVEAARAGQHGKGFAVVADEVRSLASKSADAAKETGALVENSIEKASLGATIAQDTVQAFEQIVSGIHEGSNLLNDIANSSRQQNSSIQQINQGIDQVGQIIQQNSAMAEESAASSEELSGQSEVLKELTSQFKVRSYEASRGQPPLALPES